MWPWSSTETAQQKLLKAAQEGDAATVRKLLEARDLDVDARDPTGWTALHRASWRGCAQVVELLLDANATVDATDENGTTPLHQAAWHEHAPVVELLLKANASVDVADEASASVDVADEGGETPLHKACHMHKPDVVRLLLASGANLHAKDENGLEPLHSLVTAREYESVTAQTLETLQVLMAFRVTWDKICDELVAAGLAWGEAPALALCMSLWTQERTDGLALTDVPVEVLYRGHNGTQAYMDSLKSSLQIVLRRKICLVGPSCAGKTSFVKSITTKTPQLVHLDTRTIGIDHFSLRLEQYIASRDDTKIHEVTFWDFAGQDAYQVAHSLFFSPRTLFLVCVDLEAFTVAYLQASIMSDLKKQETQLMDEFIERTVVQWIRMIAVRQPDAEFVFIATKEDLLQENTVTERLLKNALVAKLKIVEASTQQIRSTREANELTVPEGCAVGSNAPHVVFVSCTSSDSVQTARAVVEHVITKSDRSFRMPDAYTQALQAIVAMRVDAKSHDITTRIDRVFAPVAALPAQLRLEPALCRIILQTLHDLGDVLWYEDLGIELFQDRVILDPLLLIDFIRQVINHTHTGQTMPHADLKALPYWNGLSDKEQMKAMKQVLQKFHLVYSATVNRTMAWNSDLIVPAYWQTKTPAAWLFLGDILRLNSTKSCEGEVVRVHWEFHFDYGLPLSLFDHLVVASVSPYFTFDAGPDWMVYEEKEIAACRIMVGRDLKSLHRTIHVEAVVTEEASTVQSKVLWASFQHLVGEFVGVMQEYRGLDVSSFAWDDAHHKIGFERLMESNADVSSLSQKWMPTAETWTSIQQTMLKQMKRGE